MAYLVERKVTIKWKLNTDSFAVINKEVLTDLTRKFASTQKAVNMMLAREGLLRATMPNIIGKGIDDREWQREISDKWHSLSEDIPERGKELDISLNFELDNPTKKGAIDLLQANKGVKFKTDKDLANAVMADKQIKEEEYYKYCSFTSAWDMLLYIYSFDYRDIANSPDDIVLKNSPHIRFYIHDETVAKRNREIQVDKELEANDLLITILKSDEADSKIFNLLCVLEPKNIATLKASPAKDRKLKLVDLHRSKPSDFVDACKDETLHTKAYIEQLISANILKTLPGTDVIVDVEDSTLIIGNTRSDALSWFSNEVNSAKVSEYTTRLKSLN